MAHHLAAPLFQGQEEQQHEDDECFFFTCGPRARSRHAVASRVSSLALALLSFPGIALQPGDRVAILASPPRVSDDESGEAEEARRRAMSGLDASSSSASASASATAASSPRSRPLFPADAALEALLAAAAAGAVACPLNGRLPAEALAGLLASLRPRVLFAPRRRGCAEAVAGALAAAAAAAAAARREGGHSTEEGDEEGEEGAFFGLPRGPEAPVVVWLDDDDGDESAPSLSSSFAQVSSAALLSKVAREGGSSSPPASSFAPRFAPRDAAAIVFTSGTASGCPRGALISHSSLHFQSRVKESRMRLRPRDAVLHAAPLFHVAGLSAAAAALLARCRKNVLLESGGWTRNGGWRASAEGGGVTALSAVSAIVFDLAAENEAEMLQRRKKMEGGERGKKGRGGEGERAGTGKEEEEQKPPPPPPLSSVRIVLVGGGAPPPPRLLASAFPNPRVRVLTAYGLTEASSSVLWGEVVVGAGGGGGGGRASSASSSSSSPSSLLNSSPPPGVEVAVAVFDGSSSSSASSSSSSSSPSSSLSWRHAREGEEGELLTRGAHVFKGYWRDAAATRAAFLPASSSSSDSTTATTAAEASASAAAAAKTTLPWLRTGDAAVRLNETEGGCDGGIRILGRGADAIRVGGETVHAASTEASLLKSLTSTSSSSSSAAASSPKAAISGVALVGLPHPRLGQVVAALVALNSGITWRGDVVVAEEERRGGAGGGQQQRRLRLRPPPPSAGCGVPLSLSTLRAAGRAAGLPGHALPRHAVATWVPLPTRGPLAKLDRAEALRLVERAVAAGRSGGGGAGEEVDDEPRPRL